MTKYALKRKINNNTWERIRTSTDSGSLDRQKETIISNYIRIDYEIVDQNFNTTTLSNGMETIRIGVYPQQKNYAYGK